jgi:hypothetical protein
MRDNAGIISVTKRSSAKTMTYSSSRGTAKQGKLDYRNIKESSKQAQNLETLKMIVGSVVFVCTGAVSRI